PWAATDILGLLTLCTKGPTMTSNNSSWRWPSSTVLLNNLGMRRCRLMPWMSCNYACWGRSNHTQYCSQPLDMHRQVVWIVFCVCAWDKSKYGQKQTCTQVVWYQCHGLGG